MKRFIPAFLIIVTCAASSFALFGRGDAGTSSGQVLKLGAGARAAGMGEAFGSVADDATAVFWNPAGLNQLEGRSASFMHAAWLENISYDWLSYAQRTGESGVLGLGLQYLSYGAIREVDNLGVERQSFSPSDLALTISYAREAGEVPLGISVKYIDSRIQEGASAVAVDAGAMYWLMDCRLALAAVVSNLGTPLKYARESFPLPANVRLGASYSAADDLLLALDLNFPSDNEMYVGAGGEYTRLLGDTLCGALRLGYNTRAKDTGGLNGLTAGFGLTFAGYTVDYAFTPYGDLGSIHRISLGSKF